MRLDNSSKKSVLSMIASLTSSTGIICDSTFFFGEAFAVTTEGVVGVAKVLLGVVLCSIGMALLIVENLVFVIVLIAVPTVCSSLYKVTLEGSVIFFCVFSICKT